MSKQNLTRIVGIWWGIIAGLWGGVALAQDTMLEPDTPIIVESGVDPIWLFYEGSAGEKITLSTLTAVTSTSPDTTLEILYPDGQRLVYADDVVLPDGQIQSDAIIENLELPVDGVYRIRVDSFNGVSEGEVEVNLTRVSTVYDAITTDNITILRGEISPHEQHLIYTMDVPAGGILSITARDLSGTLDPVLRVYDDRGQLIASNDDHRTTDLSLDVLDAQVTGISSPRATQFTVFVSDYFRRSGAIELAIRS